MAQNIYDRPDFFANYSALARSVKGLAGAPEWPALRAMLPPIDGSRVVDLGCGFGWFCRWASEHGASEVTGIDLSENMLARARAQTADYAVTYLQADLEQLDLSQSAFDLAYSSLALHYVEDAGKLFRTVHRALAAGGRFVFSTEHPIFMAPARQEWIADTAGRRAWPVNGYSLEGPRTSDWLAKGVVKYHRTLGTTLNLLVAAGFVIDHVEEFSPTEAQVADNPALAEERERPMFLLVSVHR
jgi:SAM-dependent methyltransferase